MARDRQVGPNHVPGGDLAGDTHGALGHPPLLLEVVQFEDGATTFLFPDEVTVE